MIWTKRHVVARDLAGSHCADNCGRQSAGRRDRNYSNNVKSGTGRQVLDYVRRIRHCKLYMVSAVCSLWFTLVLRLCVYLMIWRVFGRLGDMIIRFSRILVGWKDANASHV